MESKKKTICIVPDCGRVAKSRGLCQGCLPVALTRISRDPSEEKRLIAAGLILPSQKRGPKPTNPMSRALAAMPKRKGGVK